MGFFSKLWKGPEVDLEKSGENAKKMRQMFDRVVENGGEYRLISGYTEDVRTRKARPSWSSPLFRISPAAASQCITDARIF